MITSNTSIPPLPNAPSTGPYVVYEDDVCLVVDKPNWLLSVPGRLPENKDSVITRLEKKYGSIYVVHRLDCATRGLMLVAREKFAQSELSKQFQQRTVEKLYHAEVVGIPSESQGSISIPLSTDWPNRPKQKVDIENGKPSLTHWRILSTKKASSLLELKPITGRSHQLRVHLKAIGHPILGDRLYAPLDWVKGYDTLQLIAVYLAFDHPYSRKRIELKLDSYSN